MISMILPDKKDAIHKAWLYRLLKSVADNPYLAGHLYFKGGTCASMLGWLDRFSVDLDFDYAGDGKNIPETKALLEKIFVDLGLAIKDSSKNGIQYFLKYDNDGPGRRILKIDASFPLFRSSKYQPERFLEIDRILTCQTKGTMFAHKLVAVTDRFNRTGGIAGRDIYDIHHFFMNGWKYDADVIKERTGKEPKEFLKELAGFIEAKVFEKHIDEDLNPLLSAGKFALSRKILKRETISLIKDEIKRL